MSKITVELDEVTLAALRDYQAQHAEVYGQADQDVPVDQWQALDDAGRRVADALAGSVPADLPDPANRFRLTYLAPVEVVVNLRTHQVESVTYRDGLLARTPDLDQQVNPDGSTLQTDEDTRRLLRTLAEHRADEAGDRGTWPAPTFA